MKLTAAVVAAALTAFGIHGLPIADSGVSLAVASSNIKLGEDSRLQASKRDTESELITREAYGIKSQDVAQHETLSKRAPVFWWSKSLKISDVPENLQLNNQATEPSALNTIAHGPAEEAPLGLVRSSSGAEPSDSGSGHLINRLHVSSSGQSMRTSGFANPNYPLPSKTEELELKRESAFASHLALERASNKDQDDQHISRALKEHEARFHVAQNEVIRHYGHELFQDELEDEAHVLKLLRQIESHPAVTYEELSRQSITEGKIIKILQEEMDSERNYLIRDDLTRAWNQAKARKAAIDEKLKHLADLGESPHSSPHRD